MIDEIVEELALMLGRTINGIHTAIVCEIISIYQNDAMVDVQPLGKYRNSTGDMINYPRIFKIPLAFPQSSVNGISITFPVSIGDRCLVVFSETDNNFWEGGETSDLKFQLNDGIAIPCIFGANKADFAEAYNNTSIVLKNGNTSLTIAKSGITVKVDEND